MVKKAYIREITAEDDFLFLRPDDKPSVSQALSVPAVTACAEFVSGTVAMLPIGLYHRTESGVEQVQDNRWKLLNRTSKDTLDVYQQRKQFVLDYLLKGAGYLYIERNGNQVQSLRYVDAASACATVSPDPIFRTVSIICGGKQYFDYEFLHIARNAPDGFNGVSVIDAGSEIIKAAYNSIRMEYKTAKAGGNRRGVLYAEKTVGEKVLERIKENWKKMWNSTSDNTVVLENGVKFQETSSTFQDMQLVDLKKENANEICKLFCVPPTVISGQASGDSYTAAIRTAILPVVEAITAALNTNFLLESEKDDYYWEIDISELLKGDILKRYQAYEIARKNNWMLIDEIRQRENLEALDADFITLGLNDVLYFPTSGEIYTPNTNARVQVGSNGVKQTQQRDFEAEHPRNEDGEFTFKDEKGVDSGTESGIIKAREKIKELKAQREVRVKGVLSFESRSQKVLDANDHAKEQLAARNLTIEDAQRIVDQSDFNLIQRNGKQFAYYSSEGFAVVSNGELRTIGRLDKGGEKLYMEVMKYVKGRNDSDGS